MTNFEQDKQEKRLAKKWLRELTKAAKSWVLLTVMIGFVSGILLIFQMYFLAHIAYVAYIKKLSRHVLLSNFLWLLILIIIRSGLLWLKEVVSFQTSAKVRSALRNKLLNHINQLGPIYAAKLPTGFLVSSVMEQVEALHDYLVYYLPQMSLAVLIPVAILCFVFPVNTFAGIILLICAPLIPLFMALVGMGAATLQQKHFQALSRMSVQFLDAIQGLVTLKLLGKSKQQAKVIFKASDNYRLKIMSVLKIAFLSSAVLEVFSAASIALLAIYLGMGFINTGTHNLWWSFHGLTLQGALFILLLAPEFFLPLRELGTHYHAKAKAVGAAVEINKLLALNNQSEQTTLITEFKANEIDLQLNELTISYEQSHQPALNNLSLTIKPGEKLAIIGPSGAGKSTLLNALLKFVSPTKGNILVNQHDLQQTENHEWYSHVSWLGQNPRLFKGSLRENLLLAKPDATDAELMRTLEFVKLDALVNSLAEGLDTQLGEQGHGLSGGQIQRLALARAYLKDTPLLLLDEPTASLDDEHQQLLFNLLKQFWQNKTVILSTHKLNFLAQMDRVVVLDHGVIVQQGNFNELLKDKNGLLAQLYHVTEEL